MLSILHSFQTTIVDLGIARPRLIMIATFIATVVILGALVLRVEVDTDPENMLSLSNPVRVFNRSIADEFRTRNMLFLGIVDEGGVLNAVTLANAARLVTDIKRLENVEPDGVLRFTSVSDVRADVLRAEDVSRIADDLARYSVLGRWVISEDGTALRCIYLWKPREMSTGYPTRWIGSWQSTIWGRWKTIPGRLAAGRGEIQQGHVHLDGLVGAPRRVAHLPADALLFP